MKKLNIKKIRIDGGTQTREKLNQESVDEYAEVLQSNDGEGLPPIEVTFDGTDYWLWDGFHRFHAHNKAGIGTISANVTNGTQRDAQLLSAGANAEHGIKRTNADKRKAVTMLLADDEWSKKSDRWIAEQAKVSQPFVGSMRGKSTDNVISRTSRKLDGRERPATQPVRKQEAAQESTPKEQLREHFGDEKPEEAPASIVKDDANRDVPADFRDPHSLGISIDSAGREIDQLRRNILADSEEDGGQWIPATEIEQDLKNLKAKLRESRYFTHCPRCDHKSQCDLCNGMGWIPHSRKGMLTAKEKDAINGVPF